MYIKTITPPESEVVTVPQLCNFARIDYPEQYVAGSSPQTLTDDWTMYQLFIDTARDTVESMAATACLNEQILQTADYFPGQNDPRNYLYSELSYAITATPCWWFGFPPKDSIELVRRPVLIPSGSPVTNELTVTYVDPWGNPQTLDPSTYTVFADKITLNVGNVWPVTSRMADCVQVTYWAGYSATDPTQVPPALRMAILFLAAHFIDNRSIVAIEPTSEIAFTLNRILQPFKSGSAQESVRSAVLRAF
jgi:hypothetical protein